MTFLIVTAAGALLIISGLAAAVFLLYLAAKDRAEERDDAIGARDEAVVELIALRRLLANVQQELDDCRDLLLQADVSALLARPDQEL